MATIARLIRYDYNGAFHHVMVRGLNKVSIFKYDDDKNYVIKCLQDVLNSTDGRIHIFAIKDNHLHLLYESENLGVSKFMHRFSTKYAAYYKRKYKYEGHVFQGRFKSILIQAEGAKYFLTLVRYILRNPISENISITAKVFKFTSLNSYFEPCQYKFVYPNKVCSYFDSPAQILEYISDNADQYILQVRRIKNIKFFGEKKFIEKIMKMSRRGERIEPRKYQSKITMADVKEFLREKFFLSPKDFKHSERIRSLTLYKSIASYLFSKRAHLQYSAIGKLLNISNVMVSRYIKSVKNSDESLQYIAEFDIKFKARG